MKDLQGSELFLDALAYMIDWLYRFIFQTFVRHLEEIVISVYIRRGFCPTSRLNQL